jgi:CBS domain-containing protein
MASSAAAGTLTALRAGDVMHRGLVSCAPRTSLREVAALMAEHRVHCVITDGIVADPWGSESLVWAVISDADLVRAALVGDPATTAGELAATQPLTVEADDDLALVATALADHNSAHVIVVDDERPVGVVSTLDIAAALAGP